MTFSKSHSEAQWPCCGKTRGRSVKQVVEATAVTKPIQAKDITEEATEQKIQVCYHVKQGKQDSQTWSVAQSTLNAGVSSGRCLDGEFLPPTQEPFLGPSTGTGILLLTWVPHAAALWAPPATLPPRIPWGYFPALPFPFFLQPARCFCPPVYSEASCVSIQWNRSGAFSTTKSKKAFSSSNFKDKPANTQNTF